MTSHRKAEDSARTLSSQFPGNDPRNLKKWTYRIFRNARQLEQIDRANELYAIRRDGDLYVNLCLNHIREYLACALGNIQDSSLRTSAENYLNDLGKLIDKVKRSSEQNKGIDKSLIPRFLQYHTRIFNILINKNIAVDACQNEWFKASQTSIRVWGDKVG